MAHVILGLLLIAPQTFYDLIKDSRRVALFYSASPGSIKRALDTLLTRGSSRSPASKPKAGGGRCTA
ncbi:hypothetical protein ACFQX6_42460 [Streptosporangium lutulentum]